jgi:LuxR family maltose regulon positive regulatory protein
VSKAPVDPSFQLKIAPPSLRGAAISRHWLARNCDRLRDRPLAMVRAPGGFGKTTLLATWRRELLRTGSFAGWLTLDACDDAARFIYGLVACLRDATGNPQFAVAALGAAQTSGGEIGAMTALLAAITEAAHPIVLVLDDAHQLPEPGSNVLLPYLVLNLPPNLQVVVGARQSFRMATAELAARGDYVVLGADNLRLQVEESIEFLRGRFGQRFDVDACARIHEIADGWPIALRLIVSVLEREPAADLDAIAGSTRDLEGFFVETVLSRLPAAEADLVVAVSVLDAIHPRLLSAMTEIADPEALLERWQTTTPILVAGERSDWLRMHPLARRAFAERFAALPAARQRELHWRAAEWLHQHDAAETAARHALAGGRIDLAYRWIGERLYALMVDGRVGEVLAWAERLPPEVTAQPQVRLAVGWAQALSYQHGAAAETVSPLVVDPDPQVRFEVDLIRATLAVYLDDPGQAERLVERWTSDVAAPTGPTRQVHANVTAYVLVERGESERARYLQSQARQMARQDNEGLAAGFGDLIVGISYLREARPRLAEQLLIPAVERAEAALGRRSVAASILASALGAALWEQDRRVEAESVLAYRLDVVERNAIPESVALIYVTLSRAARVGGDEPRAIELLQRLQAIGDDRDLFRLTLRSLAEQIRLHAAARRTEFCAQLAERLDERWNRAREHASPGQAREFDLTHRIGLAFAQIATYDLNAARATLEVARGLARQQNRVRDLLECRLLLAMIAQASDPEAVGALRESLSIAEANGLVRLFADTHPAVVTAVREFVRRRDADDTGASAAFVARVVGEPMAERAEQSAPVQSAPAPRRPAVAPALLTVKEALMLEHLARGMTNKEIARALALGPETVKWHLKSIFVKLNAGSRRHAVDRARMLNLL